MHRLIATAMPGTIRLDYVAIALAIFLDFLLIALARPIRDRLLRSGVWRSSNPASEARAGDRFLLILRIAGVLAIAFSCLVFYVLHLNLPSHPRYH